jgi:hypothetical protein
VSDQPTSADLREQIAHAIYGGDDRASHSMWWGLAADEQRRYLTAADAVLTVVRRAAT